MIILKTREEIDKIKRACQVVAEILLRLKEEVEPGVTTWDLNRISEELAAKKGVKPAFKGYRGYPFALCTSVNDEIVHGLPSKKKVLREGDIISLDFGVVYDGFYGDAAITVPVGKINERAWRLCKVTETSLYRGIDKARVGNRLSDISHAIQSYVEKHGYSVVREFVGHGIGRHLHESPQIPNYGPPGRGVKLKAGMVLAIEPMINEGTADIKILPDKWTAVTKDGKLSAHYEHTIAILPEGPEILSLPYDEEKVVFFDRKKSYR
ncbi:MAG: type I methionyl aminopeptidase [Deltaproteobacteria bacterium]|nr:type I methionyl aminopeptidase [Deltaproteobacteria bacterium]MBW2068360.1 type I methionyl aminopeptidase [Deltaproteobacteria bacterium]